MKKDNVIIFTRNKIFVYIPGNSEYKICKLFSDYTILSLSGIIEGLKKNLKVNHFGVLLNNDISYVVALQLSVSEKQEEMRSLVANHIPEKIPELSDNLVWDYKIVKGGNPENIQVAGVGKELIEAIVSALELSRIKVDFIEPVCYSLAKVQTPNRQYIVIYATPYEKIILFVNNGVVVYSQGLKDDVNTSIKVFLDFIRSKYTINSSCSFFLYDQLGIVMENEIKMFFDLGLKGEKRDLSKSVFLQPDDLKISKPEYAINLKLGKEISSGFLGMFKSREKKQAKSEVISTKKSKTPLLFGLLLFLLIGAGIFIYKYLNDNGIIGTQKQANMRSINNAKKSEPQTEDSKPKEKEPIVVENIKLENFKGYKVEILNGSGIKGEADKVKALIEPLGFDLITTGNAVTYNYQETEIYFKSQDLYRGVELLDASLINYPLLFSEVELPSDYPYDVKIVIGKLKNIEEAPEVMGESTGIEE